MSKRLSLSVTALCLASVLACHSDGGGGGGGEAPAPWAFGNKVDKLAFAARLPELEALTTRAQRLGLPTRDTRASGAPEGLLALATNGKGADCTGDVAVFGLTSPTRAGTGFQLADGQSCGDAIRQIRSFYAQAIDATGLTVRRLGTFKPGGALCGFRVDEELADPAVAAIAYKLTPLGAPTGETFVQNLLGAADEARVGYLSTLDSSCQGVSDVAAGCTVGSRVRGQMEAIANIKNATLDLKQAFTITSATADAVSGGRREATTQLESSLAITGLEKDGRLRAVETATVLQGALVPGGEPTRVGLAMTVEEISEGRLRLAGTVTSATGDEEAFEVDLIRQGELCRVALDPGPKPATPFDPKTLTGAWRAPCGAGIFGRLGAGRAEEVLAFKAGAGKELTRTLTVFDDAECFTGRETARLVLTGTYELTGSLPAGEGGIHEEGLNLSYRDVEVMLIDAAVVQRFNEQSLCGVDNWAVGIPRHFDAGRCYFDLGDGALMSTETLKRKTEFTAFKPEPPRRLEMARTDALTGSHVDTRARVVAGTGARRFAKVEAEDLQENGE